MASIRRFEDIKAWQLARELNREVYRLTGEGQFGRDYRFADQIRSASCSVMSNIAEGFERDSLREFVQFLKVARGSCAEVRSLLYVALDARYVDDAAFGRLQTLADEVGRVTGALRAAVERRLTPATPSLRENGPSDDDADWMSHPLVEAPASYSALGTRHSALSEEDQ